MQALQERSPATMPTIHGDLAENCSCIFTMPTIHGDPAENCSCIFTMPTIHGGQKNGRRSAH
jgi:hypothetical protein